MGWGWRLILLILILETNFLYILSAATNPGMEICTTGAIFNHIDCPWQDNALILFLLLTLLFFSSTEPLLRLVLLQPDLNGGTTSSIRDDTYMKKKLSQLLYSILHLAAFKKKFCKLRSHFCKAGSHKIHSFFHVSIRYCCTIC